MITPAVTKRKAFVVDAKLVQDRGMNVVNRERIVGDRFTKLIRSAIRHATTSAATCQEDGVTIDMMIPAASRGDFGRVGSSAHLAGPDDKGIFEHAALL